MTLLCEDANSKLVEVATVADVELRNVLTMVWCRFGSWSLVIKSFFVQTSSTRFGQNFEVLRQDFEAEVAADPWLRLWRLFLVEFWGYVWSVVPLAMFTIYDTHLGEFKLIYVKSGERSDHVCAIFSPANFWHPKANFRCLYANLSNWCKFISGPPDWIRVARFTLQ